MSGFLLKMTRHANKQENNLKCGEKSIKSDPEMTDMMELVDKNTSYFYLYILYSYVQEARKKDSTC